MMSRSSAILKRVIAGGVCADRRLTVGRLSVGRKHIAQSAPKTTIGGGGANHVIATAPLALGRRLVLFAHTGDDELGSEIRRFLVERYRIEMPLAPVKYVATSESTIICESDYDARGTIFTVPGARACDLPVEQVQEALEEAESFCLCGPAENHQIALLLAAARAACVPAYFVLGSAQISRLEYAQLQEQLEPSAELVICNQKEAQQLTGADTIEEQLDALRFGGLVRTSVVTCGEEGLWGLDNLGPCHEPAYREAGRAIVDDTGAGDAAAAAIIDSLLRGLPLQEALACGARNGFEACTACGLEHVCDAAQLQSYLQHRRHKAA